MKYKRENVNMVNILCDSVINKMSSVITGFWVIEFGKHIKQNTTNPNLKS